MNSENEYKANMKQVIGDEINRIHTAIPGVIVAYDPASNRASVQPSGKFKTQDGRGIAYPVINSVPVQFPVGMGGAAGITFPLVAGDGGIILFSETQLEDFTEGGDSDDPRKFSLNDAMFIPGYYSGAAAANVSNPKDVSLHYGGSIVTLGAGGFSGSCNGTTFSFSGGDLVVNGISLVHHTHGGVEPGGGSTGQPK